MKFKSSVANMGSRKIVGIPTSVKDFFHSGDKVMIVKLSGNNKIKKRTVLKVL